MGALVEPGGTTFDGHAEMDDEQLLQLAIASCSELANGRGFGPLDALIASLPGALAPELADGASRNPKTDVYAVAAAISSLAGDRELPKPFASLVRQGTSMIPEHRPGPALMGAELSRAARRLGFTGAPPRGETVVAPVPEVVATSVAPVDAPPIPVPVAEVPVVQEPVAEVPVVEEPVVEETPAVEPEPEWVAEPEPDLAPVTPLFQPHDEPATITEDPAHFNRHVSPVTKVALGALFVVVAFAGAYVGFRAANRADEGIETAVKGTAVENTALANGTSDDLTLKKGVPVAEDVKLSVAHFAQVAGPKGQTELKLQIGLAGQFNRSITLPSGPGARLALATAPLTGEWAPAGGTTGEPVELPGAATKLGSPATTVIAVPPNPAGFTEPFTDANGTSRTSLATTMGDNVLEGEARIEQVEKAGDDLVFRVPNGTTVVGLVLVDEAGTLISWVLASDFGPPEPPDSF